MTKADLEKKVLKLELEAEQRNAQITKAIKKIIDDNCEEAIEPCKLFCKDIGLPFPSTKVVMMVDYGEDLDELKVYDNYGNDVGFEIVKE